MKGAYMRPSALPDTTPVPSALKAAAVTGSECDAIVRRHLPVATSQIFTFSSKDPLTYSTYVRQSYEAPQDGYIKSAQLYVACITAPLRPSNRVASRGERHHRRYVPAVRGGTREHPIPPRAAETIKLSLDETPSLTYLTLEVKNPASHHADCFPVSSTKTIQLRFTTPVLNSDRSPSTHQQVCLRIVEVNAEDIVLVAFHALDFLPLTYHRRPSMGRKTRFPSPRFAQNTPKTPRQRRQ